MHRLLVRRLGALVVTVLVACALAHVMFASSVDGVPVAEALRGVPEYLADTLRGELGTTPGGGCDPTERVAQCASWGPGPVSTLLRERGLVDLQLLAGALVLGLLAGVLAGRHCAAHPGSWRTRSIHGTTALLLSCPPYFLAFCVLVYFSWSSGRFPVPFVSGQADFKAFGADPLGWLKAMWAPWVIAGLPLAAYVARITEASLREILDEDFIRTAVAKGLGPGRVLNRHALPVAAPAIAAMTGVNVSTILINVAAIEYGFSLPGMFTTIRGAVLGGDVAVLQALVLEGVVLACLANFVVDAVQVRLDPRVAASSA